LPVMTQSDPEHAARFRRTRAPPVPRPRSESQPLADRRDGARRSPAIRSGSARRAIDPSASALTAAACWLYGKALA
jgi:hypothetical protein